jgi:spoIIIJ-associated protein
MASKISTSKIERETVETTEEVLEELGVEAKVSVKSSDSLIETKITGEDLGLLIGYRGENLESLQLILGIIINNKLKSEPRIPVLIDVGDWRAQREESLRTLVAKEVTKLDSGDRAVELPPMPPSQRRTTHLLVKEHEGLTSESVGEEPNRHIVIKKDD